MNDSQGSSQKLENLEDELNRIEAIAKNEAPVAATQPQPSSPQSQPETPLQPNQETPQPAVQPEPVDTVSAPESTVANQVEPVVQTPAAEQPNPIKPAFTQELQPEEKMPPMQEPLTGNKKSSKTLMIILIVLFVLSLGGLGFYYLGAKKSELAETPAPMITSEPTPTATVDPTAAWKIYSTSIYQLKYPLDVNLKEDQGSQVVFSKLGPTQTEGTEVFDGFSVSFKPKEISGQTLQAYVAAKIAEIEKQGISEIISDPSPIVVNNYQGLTYTEKGLGEFKQVILQSKDGGLFMEISSHVADPGNLGFQEIVDKMLNTFNFIQSAATASASPAGSPSASASATPRATP